MLVNLTYKKKCFSTNTGGFENVRFLEMVSEHVYDPHVSVLGLEKSPTDLRRNSPSFKEPWEITLKPWSIMLF